MRVYFPGSISSNRNFPSLSVVDVYVGTSVEGVGAVIVPRRRNVALRTGSPFARLINRPSILDFGLGWSASGVGDTWAKHKTTVAKNGPIKRILITTYNRAGF